MTQATIAARLGVSIMTVSNALNASGRVSTATRARVAAAAAELGYRRGQSAVPAPPRRIGILYNHPESAFVSEVLAAALDTSSAAGVRLLGCRCDDPSPGELRKALRRLVRSGAEAILVMPPFAEMLRRLGSELPPGFPLAAVSGSGNIPGIPTVRVDDRAAAQAAVDMLIVQGHRRIGFVGGNRRHSVVEERLAGYLAALRSAALDLDEALVLWGDFSLGSGAQAAAVLLDNPAPPSAIFACNDDMAVGVLMEAGRRQLAVPGDVAIVGFDDLPVATQVSPPITAVKQPIREMAQRAIALLLSRLNERPSDLRRGDRILPFALIQRSSTGLPDRRASGPA